MRADVFEQAKHSVLFYHSVFVLMESTLLTISSVGSPHVVVPIGERAKVTDPRPDCIQSVDW